MHTRATTKRIANRQRWDDRSQSQTVDQPEYAERFDLPSLDKILPHVIPQSIRTGQLLDEMLDRILTQTEEVRPRNTV